MDVTLQINYPRSEKRASAWNAFHTSMGMAFSNLVGTPDGNRYQPSTLPPNFWREPHTGVIMLKPGFMVAHRLSSQYQHVWLQASDFSNAGTNQLPAASAFAISSGSTGTTAAWYQAQDALLKSLTDYRLALSVDGRLSALTFLTDDADNPYVWNVQTNDPLAPNQGWCGIISPSGIYGDCSGGYIAIGFGGRFAIEITTAGVAYLYGYNGTAWTVLQDFDLHDGGVNHLKPYQVNVIPFGKRFIHVSFTENQLGKHGTINPAPSFNEQQSGFLVVLRGGNFEPYWDSGLQQWIKTDAAPLTIALRKKSYRYDFIFGKALYLAGYQSFTTAVEYLPKRPTWGTVTEKHVDFSGEYEPGGGSPNFLDVNLKGLDGSVYDPAVPILGAAVVAKVGMSPSGDGTNPGIYTPELCSLSLSYPPDVHTSGLTPVDVSSDYQLIRFQKTTKPEASRFEIKMRDDSRWQSVLKSDGTYRLTVVDNSGNAIVVSDGYLRRNAPTLEGMNTIITSQREGLDMWHRLDGTPVSVDALENELVADVIKKVILACGFQPAEVVIDYAGSPELASLTFAKFTNPADVLRPNEDCSAGDFIRSCIEHYGMQDRTPLRVRWVSALSGPYWKIYFGPIYTPGTTNPDFFFYHETSAFPSFESQTARYQAGYYKILSSIEILTQQPAFNALLAKNSQDTSGQQGSNQACIPADPRVLTDPTYVAYEGAENVKELNPQDLPMANTSDSLEQQLRWYFDLHYNLKELRTIEVSCEWQPEVDVDKFAVIVGRAKFDDPGGRFAKGDPVSYGVYRIDFIDCEIRHDGPGPDTVNSRRWEWTGSYKFVFVNKWEASDHSILMFTTDDKLPL